MSVIAETSQEKDVELITGHIVCDAKPPNFPIVSVSKGYCELTGYCAEEIIGKSSSFLQGDKTDNTVVAQIRQTIRQGRIYEGSLLNYRKDGTLFINQLKVEPLFNSAGEITHFMGQQTGPKPEINPALSSLEETVFNPEPQSFRRDDELVQIEQVTGVGMLHIDASKLCYQVNDNIQNLTGIRDQSLMQEKWLDCIHPDDRLAYEKAIDDWMNSTVTCAEGLINKFRVVTRDNSIVYVKSFISKARCALQYPDSFLVLWFDVSDLTKVQVKLSKQKKETDAIMADVASILSFLDQGVFDFSRDSCYRHHPIVSQSYSLADTLQTLNRELTLLSKGVAINGALGGKAHIHNVTGGWSALIDHVNAMSHNITVQVREMTRIATAVLEGDLSQRMEVDASGEFYELKVILNNMVDQLNQFFTEVNRVAREVGTDGVLGGQATVSGARGKWRILTDAVNTMASNLTIQVRDIIEVATAVAHGDLSKKISADVQGEVLAFKTTVNAMVDNLRLFSTQVISVARAIGEEGLLGQHAHVPDVQGCWKQLTDQINLASDNLTDQVRGITHFAQKLSDGMLDAELSFNSPGEINSLVSSLVKMKENLQKTAEQAERITQGDFTVTLKPASSYDVTGHMIATMTETLKDKTKVLRESELLLNEFLSHSQDVFIRLSSDLVILFLSDSFEKITGQKAFQWVGLNIVELSSDVTEAFITQAIQHKGRGNDKEQTIGVNVFKVATPSGLKVFDAAIWPIINGGGRIKEYHLMARDITCSFHVYERNKLFQTLQDNAPIMYSVINLGTRELVYVNALMKQRIGLDHDKHKIFIEDIHSSEEVNFIEEHAVPALLETGFWSGQKNISFPHTQSKPLTVYVCSKVTELESGDLLCACTMMDISEQILREHKIRQQQEQLQRFKDLQDRSPAMYFIVDAETEKNQYMSLQLQKLIGVDIQTSEELYIKDFHSEEEYDYVQQEVFPLLYDQGHWSGRLNITVKDQPTKTMYGNIFVVVDPDSQKRLLYGILVDLTKEMLWEKEKNLNQKQLNRLLRLSLAAEISTGIAHQLTQPLSALSSLLQLLDSASVKGKQWQDNVILKLPYLIGLTHEMGHTIHQVKDLLTNNNLSNPIEFDLYVLCVELVDDYKDSYPNVTFRLSVSEQDEGASFLIKFDQCLLGLAIRNLLNNAVEAVDSYGNKAPTIAIVLGGEGHCVELRICDNGPGVAPELRQRIFEPFYSTKDQGTGTGLSLVQRLSECYGLQVCYDERYIQQVSTRGGVDDLYLTGACFTLRLSRC